MTDKSLHSFCVFVTVAVKRLTRSTGINQLRSDKNQMWRVCLYFCLSYPACKLHLFCPTLYCHIRPVWLNNIFPHCLINSTIFGEKKLFNIKFVFWFSLQRLSETFLTSRRTKRDIIINLHRCLCKGPVILVRFQSNLNIRDVFSGDPKISNLMKIHIMGAELSMPIDRCHEAHSRFSQFCERA
jgi:hypothetical protein